MHEFCFQRHDLGFERIICNASQFLGLLVESGRPVLLPHAYTVSDEPRSMVNVQLPILIANRFGHYVLLNDPPCSHSPADDPATHGVPRYPTGSVRIVRAENAESDRVCASRWSVNVPKFQAR